MAGSWPLTWRRGAAAAQGASQWLPQRDWGWEVGAARATAHHAAKCTVASSTFLAPSAVVRWRKVGWIWAQSTKERDFIMSSEEICQCAAVQVGRAAAWQAGAGGSGCWRGRLARGSVHPCGCSSSPC